jgi:hypothetical protein
VTDPHIEALDAAIKADHERLIAEIRAEAAAAADRGDQQAEQWHLERIARLEAISKPWERRTA